MVSLFAFPLSAFFLLRHCKMRMAAHGVTMKEIASENSIAALAPFAPSRR